MNITEFFDAYLDIWVESNRSDDPTTNQQCVDLWRVYNQKVVGGPFMYGNAVDFWTNYPVDFYDKIPNTPEGVPQLGDVIIWGTRYGKYGHIAVCTDIADVKGFTSFDQNDPINEACHFQPHSYTGVLGWLRPKDQNKVLGHPEENIAVKILTDAFTGLPEGDSLKPGNLEGYARAITGEHLNYSSLEKDSKQFQGFVTKWVVEYNLPSGSGLVQIESEMSKLLDLEDQVNRFRSAIESVVGPYITDEGLLEALLGIKADVVKLNTQLTDCQNKLTNSKVLWAFQLGNYLIKIYKE
jgi:hypothetical protein